MHRDSISAQHDLFSTFILKTVFHKTSLFDRQKESLDVKMKHPSTHVTGNLCFVLLPTLERLFCATL